MNRVTTQGSTPRTGLMIAILGLLAAFAPFATDMYLPGFAVMADHFDVETSAIEVTLSVFFLGLAIGQGSCGPVIDRYGRRTPLLVGIGLYVAATAACLMTDDIILFSAFRFLQAVGGCAGMIIGRAIVSDLFDGREAARVLSLVMAAIGAIGFVAANATSLAMAASRDASGSGSALIGVLQFGIAFLVSSIVTATQDGTAFPMTIAIAACPVLAVATWVLGRERKS